MNEETQSAWRWQEGEVDTRQAYIQLYHEPAATGPRQESIPMARIGKPRGHVFPVEWLVAKGSPEVDAMIDDTRRELDFFLIEHPKRDLGPNMGPWEYALYHCGTA